MKKYFNNKQMESLKPAEQYFYTIKYADYKRASTSKINELVANILDEVLDKPVTRNFNCGKCIYDIFQQAANIYYNTIEKNNETTNKENETTGKPTRKSRKSKSSTTGSEPTK